MDNKEQTLLHVACMLDGSYSDEVGQQLIKLLLEKGFDPIAKDCDSNQAAIYLSPDSPSWKLMKEAAGMKIKRIFCFKFSLQDCIVFYGYVK